MIKIQIIFGILIFFKISNASPGLIDISHFKSSNIFSKPTKIGEVLFYIYSCDDSCTYTNVFDRDFKIFPRRPNTRLVSLVLVVKDENIQLIQVMFSDIKNDYRLNNLFYRKSEDSWELVDNLTYKSDLLTLKNNYVSFDLNKPENKGFEKQNLQQTHGYDTYTLKDGYELEKICSGKNVVWEFEPYYTFKSLDITESSEGPDRLRINYTNYFSEVNQYYKNTSGKWSFDVSQRQVDLLSLSTHGWKRRKLPDNESEQLLNLGLESDPDRILWLDEHLDFDEKLITFKVTDLCDLNSSETHLDNLYFNLNFDKKDFHDLTIFRYESYDITSYEFVNLIGCRLVSIYSGNIPIFEFNPGSGSVDLFHDIKISYVPNHPVLVISLTSLKKVESACDHITNTCKEAPYLYKTHFFKRTDDTWFCLEKGAYYSELNKMLEVASSITMKKLRESLPETPTLIPSTPNLDYGGKQPFTYDLNNPFEVKFKQDLIFTDPDLIKLQVKPEFVLNVIVDGQYILWEQKESGYGCLLIYIYRSDDALLSHMVIDSRKEKEDFGRKGKEEIHKDIHGDNYKDIGTLTHLFFRHSGKRWVPTTKDDYEKSKKFYKGFKYIIKKPKPPIDEYILPDDLLDKDNHSDTKMDPLSGLDLTAEALNYIKSASKSHNL